MRQSGPHKAYGLFVHVTWHTWRRQALVRRGDVQVITEAIHGAAQRTRVHVLAQAILADHVHLLLSCRPDRALATFVRDAKSESARRVNVHVPFCVRRCTYCDFSIAVRRRIPAQEYLAAVLREVALIRAADPAPAAGSLRELGSGNEAPPSVVEPEAGLQTLYFGGGTPSLLPVDALAALLTTLREAFHERSSRDDLEVTLEATPEDVTGESARAWAVAGVNRVSLGAQSFDDAVLKWMHRSHDGARIGEAVDALRHAGIP